MIVPISLLLACATPPPWQEGAESQALLDAVRLAQQANADRFPHGKLRCRVSIRQNNPIRSSVNEIHAQWSDGALWAAVVETSAARDDAHRDDATSHHEEWIVDRARHILHHPASRRVIVSDAAMEPATVLWAPPSRYWFGPLQYEGASWRPYLDPSLVPQVDATRVSLKAWRRPGGLVEVSRRDEVSGSSVRLVCSMEQEGNVTEYEIENPSPRGDTSSRGTCRWEREAGGAWFPRRSTRSDRSKRHGAVIEVEKIVEVLEFDPRFRPDPSRFTLESLDLVAGTVIEDQINGTTRRIGDRAAPTVVDQLDALGDAMRRRGFASETRGR